MKILLQNKWLILFFLFPVSIPAQSDAGLDHLKYLFEESVVKSNGQHNSLISNADDFKYEGLVNKTSRLLFTIYKSYFSSQDMNSCNFHPSCSEYGLRSVRKFGLVIGGIKTFDRMTRCNPFSLSSYQYDSERKRFIDPVQ